MSSNASDGSDPFGAVYQLDTDLKVAFKEYFLRNGISLDSDVQLKFSFVNSHASFSCDVVPAVRDEHFVATSPRTMLRDQQRIKQTKVFSDMAREDGYCYLSVFKHRFRMQVRDKLGPNPTVVRVITTLTPELFNGQGANEYHVVRQPGTNGSLHLTSAYLTSEFHDFGTFVQVLVSTAKQYGIDLFHAFPSVSFDTKHVVPLYDSIGAGSMARSVSSTSSEESFTRVYADIADLQSLEFNVREFQDVTHANCFCDVHRVHPKSLLKKGQPLTSVVDIISRTARKVCDTVGIASSEKQFASYYHGYSTGTLTRSQATALLSTVRMVKAHCDWGLGYSYLMVMPRKYRNIVAATLGPFPLLYDVHVMMKFVSIDRCTFAAVEVIDSYHCHFVDDTKKTVIVFDEVLSTVVNTFQSMTVV